jgi:hypothetical protein
MRFIRVGTGIFCLVLLTACGTNGILGLNPKPDGDIVITNSANGALLQTTAAKPYVVSGGAFSLGITENYFTGPYLVTVIAWTAPFNIPCFVPHYVDQNAKTNVVDFTADNAAPVTAPTQASPCNSFVVNGVTQLDQETVRISDNDGHVVNFYYKVQ